jgi:hypothetical protein
LAVRGPSGSESRAPKPKISASTIELCAIVGGFVPCYLHNAAIIEQNRSSSRPSSPTLAKMSAPTNSVRSAFELTGRNYIVTGGAQGIGFTISRAICEMGGNVAIWDIQEKPVDQKEFDSWSSTFGSKTLYVQTDVTKQDSLEAAFQKTMDVFQTVDGCVPSAGIAIDKPFIDQTWEEFTRIQEINVRKNCCRLE